MYCVISLTAATLTTREVALVEMTRLYMERRQGNTAMPNVLSVATSYVDKPNEYTYCFSVRGCDADQIQCLLRAVDAFRQTSLLEVSLFLHHMRDGTRPEQVLIHHGSAPHLLPGQSYLNDAMHGRITVGVPLNLDKPIKEDPSVSSSPTLAPSISDDWGLKVSPSTDEDMFQTLYKASLQETFGHKPWGADGDTTFFANRCICRINDAIMVAEPCEHLCLCPACYEDLRKANAAFLERCPKCGANVTRVYNIED
jgi:hypothetical protein